MNTENEAKINRTIFDACPLPWRIEKTMHRATKTCHHAYATYQIKAANGNRVMMTEKLMTAFVTFVNRGLIA